MSVWLISAVALLASGLTFFSGFGLGTLLLPAFALFVPVEQAVALTAVVHFLNSIYKVVLVGRFIDTKPSSGLACRPSWPRLPEPGCWAY